MQKVLPVSVFLVVFGAILNFTVASNIILKSNSTAFSWASTRNFLAFGDSYTYVEGAPYGETNFSFIGDAFNFSFTPSQLFSSELLNNYTSSGGSNWPEFLTGCFAGLPNDCPDKKLWDFAYAGADVSSAFLNLHHNTSLDLVDQVRQWDEFGRVPLNLTPAETLVGIFIGINDISDSARWTNVSFPVFYDQIIDSLFDSVETIYSRGFKNFLFLGLPPLDKTPGNLVSPNPLPNRTMIDSWDGSITSHAEALHANHADTNVVVFDTYEALQGILDSPAEFGIVNTTSFCAAAPLIVTDTEETPAGCAVPVKEYFWYNTGHITFTVHQVLAAAIEETLVGFGG